MKIILSYFSDKGCADTGQNILVWPDSSLIHTGKPLFLADDEPYCALPGLIARITSVGKTVSRKFASRYYKEVAPCMIFVTEKVAGQIINHEDPAACDIAADYSIVCGKFKECMAPSSQDTMIEVVLSPLTPENVEFKETFRMNGFDTCMEDAIVTASKKNTIKTGDFVGTLLPKRYTADPDTLLRVKIGDEVLIETKLK